MNSHEVLPNIPSDGLLPTSEGAAFLADSLLRRGFPVWFEDRGLSLCPGAMKEDSALFSKTLHRIPTGDNESDHLDIWDGNALIHRALTNNPRKLQSFREWVIGRGTYRGSGFITSPRLSIASHRFDEFKACRFGSRFPLVYLEPGIALLVKVLPWVGVFTTMSCQGHPERDASATPKLWFYSNYHSQWCELIFQTLCADLPIASSWRFDHSESKTGWRDATWVASEEPITSAEQQWVLFDQIQLMARRFFAPRTCEELRNIKQSATDMKHLRQLMETFPLQRLKGSQ